MSSNGRPAAASAEPGVALHGRAQRGVVADAVVLQRVEGRRVDERAVERALREQRLRDAEVLLLGLAPVRDVPAHPLPFPRVGEVRHRREPARDEHVALLAVVELRQALQRHGVELEVAGEAVESLHEAREDVPHAPAPPERARTEEGRDPAHRAERAPLRRPVVEGEVPVHGGALAREDRRDRRAAVSELHLDRAPVRQQVPQETVSLGLLPAERVDEDEDADSVLFHGRMSSNARARAATSPGGTSVALPPQASGRPPIAKATTGRPSATASAATSP